MLCVLVCCVSVTVQTDGGVRVCVVKQSVL